ncbi:anion exchange family protein [Auriculariales sp. MPI-PUGE-AT-0066]|nr:anion exchange family protein [Auriculariales sp. MPI-PUGE-AT-0066]
MFLLNLAPAISYLIDMNRRTHGVYGLNEVLLATALPLLVFSIFSAQPLTIVGFTGLASLFNFTNFDILERCGLSIDQYQQFQAWMLLWAAIMHILIAVFNGCDYTRFITEMTSTTFGLYVGVIYIQKGVEVLVEEFHVSTDSAWVSVLTAILFAVVVYLLERAAQASVVPFSLRRILEDWTFFAGLLFFSGFVHISGHIKEAHAELLPVTAAFKPTLERDWVVPFWKLEVAWVFAAIPFGFLLTLLFYFDHNVSSLMAQARHFPVQRPAGFHWDFFLLGITTLISGILGLPAPNGLVPQAPVHTESLSVKKLVTFESEVDGKSGTNSTRTVVVRTRVVEQRVSHLAMGLLTLGTMTGPLLKVLSLMPRAVFAGIFLLVGWASIEDNPIIHNTIFLVRERRTIPHDHPLRDVRKVQIAKFVSIQWLVFGSSLALSQTLAAIGFPLVFMALIPVRHFILPKFFARAELDALDAPTANAPNTLVSIGGPLPESEDEATATMPGTGTVTPKAHAHDVETVQIAPGEQVVPVVHDKDIVGGVGAAR